MSKLDQLTILSKMLIDAGEKKDQAELDLKKAKENERRLREEAIPLLMFELGLKSIGLDDGTVIQTDQAVFASITEAKKAAAFKWLEENKFSGLIKTQVEINFSRGDHELAKKWHHFLKESKNLDADLQESVHPQTLKAFVKEQIQAGNPVPMDLFGVMVVDTTKIKTPKKKS